LLVLISAVVLAGGLRLHGLGEEDYWFDELHSMLNSAGTQAEFLAIEHGVIIEEVPRLTKLIPGTGAGDVWDAMECATQTHPPLYFTLLHLWRRGFGDGEFSCRLPSVLFSILSIIPVFLILRTCGKTRAGAAAAILLAISFSHILVAQQNRHYSLALASVGFSFWFWSRLECRQPRRNRRRELMWGGLYACSLAVAMLTHYFAALPLVGLSVYVLIHVRGRLLGLWMVSTTSAAVAFALLWGHRIPRQWAWISAQDWLVEGGPDHVLHTLVRLANLPIRLMFRCEAGNLNLLYAALGLTLIGAVVYLLRRRWGRMEVMFALWFLVPVGFAFVMDVATSRGMLAHVRYAVLGVPGLAGLLALGVDRLSKRGQAAFWCVLAIGVLLSFSYPTRMNPQAQEATELLAAQTGPGDLVVYDGVDQPWYWADRLMLLTTYKDSELHHAVLLLNAAPSGELLARIAKHDRVFLVAGWTADQKPSWMPSSYRLMRVSDPLWGLGRIQLYQRKGSDVVGSVATDASATDDANHEPHVSSP